MTDIEQKALALVNEALGLNSTLFIRAQSGIHEALCRAIEQHETDIADLQAEYDEMCKLFEAFQQAVSDKIEICRAAWPGSWAQFADALDRFIIAKPDPLVEVLRTEWPITFEDGAEDHANQLRAAIEARGGKIVWGEK